MGTAEKLMDLAIDGGPEEEVEVTTSRADATEVVEEEVVTRQVRRRKPRDKVVVIEEA